MKSKKITSDYSVINIYSDYTVITCMHHHQSTAKHQSTLNSKDVQFTSYRAALDSIEGFIYKNL